MSTKTINLSTLSAAMDSVNAARTEEELINDEINIDSTKAKLRAKLKSVYAENGITDVTDDVIEKGVNDYYDSRFRFVPMERGLKYTIALAYINRKIIALRGAIVMGAILAIILLFIGFNHLKRKHEANKIIAAKEAVAKVEADRKAAEARAAQAKKNLEAEIANLLNEIPKTGEACLAILKEGPKARIEALVSGGVAAVKANDLATARNSHQELKGIFAELNLEYELHINAKPSVFWRKRDDKPNDPQYYRHYAIVNATFNNRPVTIDIRNAETQRVARLSQWAEQISKDEYERIRAEKAKFATLKDTLFGRKEKGYMQPKYNMGLKRSGDIAADSVRFYGW